MSDIKSPLSAIKQFCYECSGENRAEVKRCTGTTCALFPFRAGKNPYRTQRKLTPEQRAAAAERFRAMRERKEAENG